MTIKEIVDLQPQPEGVFPTIFDRRPGIVKKMLREIKKKLPKDTFNPTKGVSLNDNTYALCYRRKDMDTNIEKFWLITGCKNVKNELRKYYDLEYSGNFYRHWSYYEIKDKV